MQYDLFTELDFGPIKPEFFNTINLTGVELTKAKETTGLQDQRVLSLFQRYTIYSLMTPIRVHTLYNMQWPEAPLTSIRRSMTVLTKKGLLIKTSDMLMEKFGKRNYMWRIV